MARYIDAEELKKRAYPFPCAIGVEYAVSVRQIDETPTADVVPNSEVERLEHILNCYALQYGTVTDQQKVIDKAKSEVAREIFAEIEKIATAEGAYDYVSIQEIAEIKKKYTEEKK